MNLECFLPLGTQRLRGEIIIIINNNNSNYYQLLNMYHMPDTVWSFYIQYFV